MATKLAIDDQLLVLAQSVGGLKSKKEAVNLALKEFVQKRQQVNIIDLFGEIEYDDDFNYKRQRYRT
ncbi:MAG: type II toxin-antitoxin system VapB family antitoxin, partial [Sphaerochaetaceae bacterium]|nr:type II toxin-antitoxin system VapB family antitoxin [Sphaerochaetaceae bacterium]